MEILTQHAAAIFAAITAICGAIISVTAFLKSLRSEKRTRSDLAETNKNVAITRQGIVEAFKNTVVTKDIKVSLNNQLDKRLNELSANITSIVKKNEERRTKMTYWVLKILAFTAAFNKLTTEQQAELDELLALINEDEQIIDTDIN